MGARPRPLPPARSHGPAQARSTRDPRRHPLDPLDGRALARPARGARPLGHPLDFHLTAGQAHETTGLVPLLEGAEERVVDGDGDPIAWPVALAGDKGFRADWVDEYLLGMGITPVIPSKENEDRAARAVEFDRELYRRRSIVECLIGWLKECRRVFSRFEKTA